MSEVQKSKSGFWRDFTWKSFGLFFAYFFGTSLLVPYLFGDENRDHVWTLPFLLKQGGSSALIALMFSIWGIGRSIKTKNSV